MPQNLFNFLSKTSRNNCRWCKKIFCHKERNNIKMRRTRVTRPNILRKKTSKVTARVLPPVTQDSQYVISEHSYTSHQAKPSTLYAIDFLNQFVNKVPVPVETNTIVKEEPQDLPIETVMQDGHHSVSEHCQALEDVKIKHEPLKSLEQLVENPFRKNPAPKSENADLPIENTADNSSISEPSSRRVKVEMDDFLLLCHKAFNYFEIKHRLSFRFSVDVADYCAYYANIVNTLEDVTKKSLMYANSGDKIQIELRNADFKSCISVILADENDLSSLRALLDLLGQANTFVNELEMVVQIVQVPNGGTGEKRPLEEILDSEWIKKKRRYLHLVNNPGNQLCFAISLAHCLHPGANDHQAATLGAEMQKKAGLTDQTPVTFGDITKFEKLINCKIVVFYHEGNSKQLSKFITAFENRYTKPLFLYLYQNHYFGIRNLSAFLSSTYFCEQCYQTSKNPRCPVCTNHCPICLDPDCTETENRRYCKDCARICRSTYCFKAHKKPTWRPAAKVSLSECDLHKAHKKSTTSSQKPLTRTYNVQMCDLCCIMCGEKLDNNQHNCHIQPLTSAENHNKTNLIFYEFKTFVDESGQNVPFALSTKSIQGETWSSYGELCIIDFLLHFRCTTFSNSTFIAHNIDSSVILNTMIDMGVKPNVITQTGKIVCIEDPDYMLKFTDSASFFPVPLVALPETFGFNSFKRLFPVRFISKANLEYIGPCPPPEFYKVPRMDEKKRQEFETAYELARICDFDFKREAKVYCEEDTNDVAIACLDFRRYFINLYDVNPFSCATFLSFAMKIFCTKFLAPSTLAIPRLDNYKSHVTTSSPASIEWLEWVMFSENVFIQHALNKGVKSVCNLNVDGYSDANDQNQLGTVWEFITCLESGCPTCYPAINQFKQRHKRCQEKLKKLQSSHKLVIMREHSWNEMKRSHKELQEFLRHFKPPQPLTPQEALYENLNCAVKLRHSTSSDEKIQLVQVNSLFPHVMMNNFYPLGHPKLIFNKFEDFPNYFGLIKAVLYPPRELYFPVLPYKNTNGKVVYTLCRSCANANCQQGPCVHNDEDRALTGVWVSPEFNKALEMGYKVGKILEVWHFHKKSKMIFDNYVKSLVKGKQESLGYPPEAKDCRTQETYVREFEAKQGIMLDKDRIKLNVARRHMFDGCLDNLWQGFGNRSPQINSEIVTSNEDLVKYMFSGMYHVKYFTVLSDKAALVQWTSDENKKQLPNNTENIFVTAFTAAYGRLFFYNILEKLKERVLYYDTDSLFYIAQNAESEFDFGTYLGQLTDKLAGDSIQEFASFGPKSYAYQTKTNRVVLNVKGIMQTVENCKNINFSTVKDMVEGYVAYCDQTETEMIKPEQKVVYDKRQLLPNGRTLPFGY